jgi:hypothetical protein
MKNVSAVILDRDDLKESYIQFDEISLESFKNFLKEDLFQSLKECLVMFTDYDLRTKIINNPYGNKAFSKNELIKVSFEDYEYTCSDGCCHDYGTIVTVNGTELPNHNYQDPGNTVEQVLNYLGYNVEIEYL